MAMVWRFAIIETPGPFSVRPFFPIHGKKMQGFDGLSPNGDRSRVTGTDEWD